MDIEDDSLEFLENHFGCSCFFEGNEMSVRGKSVHDNHDSRIAIGFVEGASEVYSDRLVGFVRGREGLGSSWRKGSGFVVNLTFITRPAVEDKVLSHLGPPEETSGIRVAFVS